MRILLSISQAHLEQGIISCVCNEMAAGEPCKCSNVCGPLEILGVQVQIQQIWNGGGVYTVHL